MVGAGLLRLASPAGRPTCLFLVEADEEIESGSVVLLK
jgi:hypothetical protein